LSGRKSALKESVKQQLKDTEVYFAPLISTCTE